MVIIEILMTVFNCLLYSKMFNSELKSWTSVLKNKICFP